MIHRLIAVQSSQSVLIELPAVKHVNINNTRVSITKVSEVFSQKLITENYTNIFKQILHCFEQE